jgi:hypothetical protein
VERNDCGSYTSIGVWILLLEASGDRIHLRLRLFERNTGLRARNDLQVVPSAAAGFLRAEGDGNPQLILRTGELELWWHNADDRQAHAIQGDGLPDNVNI